MSKATLRCVGLFYEMLQRLGIVVLRVRDWKKAIAWYTEKLDLKVSYIEEADEWAQLIFPDGQTNLAILGDRNADLKSDNRFVPNILVLDLNDTVDRLKQRGVQFMGDIRGEEGCFRIITMIDPEENRLQLYELINNSK